MGYKIIKFIAEVLPSVGLKINENKTKYLVTGFGQGTESNFSSGHYSFEAN